jgi:hypothetical protein
VCHDALVNKTGADRWLRSVAIAYTAAVERDIECAHPIQDATLCFPPGFVHQRLAKRARALYHYSIFLYDEAGIPLTGTAVVSVGRWMLFEDVYLHGCDGCSPVNARTELALLAGFRVQPGRGSQKIALDLWAKVLDLWGPPKRGVD